MFWYALLIFGLNHCTNQKSVSCTLSDKALVSFHRVPWQRWRHPRRFRPSHHLHTTTRLPPKPPDVEDGILFISSRTWVVSIWYNIKRITKYVNQKMTKTCGYIHTSISITTSTSMSLSIYLPTYLSIYLTIFWKIYLFAQPISNLNWLAGFLNYQQSCEQWHSQPEKQHTRQESC